MTTIAYDGHTIAADTLETFSNGERCPYPVEKIMRCSIPGMLGQRLPQERSQRVIVGYSGSLVGARRLLQHYVTSQRVLGQPIHQPDGDNSNMIVIHLDESNRAFLVSNAGGLVEITGKKMALGSGSDYALGAMYAGYSAHRAVEVAARLNVFTGDEVVSIVLATTIGESDGMYPYYLDQPPE